MAANKNIRCYDYVNHPYEKVRETLKSGASKVFRKATKSAAIRAQDVAAELHVNVAGVELGKDIAITIKDFKNFPKEPGSPPVTKLNLEWAAVNNPGLFPKMEGELSLYPLTSTETQLDFSGSYEVPLGVVGSMLDAVIGHRIAEASLLRFIRDVASHLREELADH